MRLQDICEKMNPNVTFKYTDDIEGDRNRGWTVDQIDAYLNGEKVGYLKLSYIPHERFKRYYPGILNWLSQIGGHHTLPYDYKDSPWQGIPTNELRKSIFSLAQTCRIDWNTCNKLSTEAKTMNDIEIRNLVRELENKLWEDKGWQFRRFKQYYVDKPIVDYIRVEEPYKRQGIGTALYRAGHEWMKSKGMKMYASSTQSDEAKATWKAMRKQFPMARDRVVHPFARDKRVTRKHFA